MADVEEDSSRSRKRSFVALTGQPVVTERAILISNCVSEGTIARSGLLSGLESTEGLASLPCNLSPDKVCLWETAYLARSDFPLDELVTVLKVSDALGDTNIARWQEQVAKRLLSTEWEDNEKSNDTMCSLLRLPPHLLRRVLSSCHQQSTLPHLLSKFPPVLHPALVEAAAADGSLDLTFGTASAALSVLLTSAMTGPVLKEIQVQNNATDVLPTATAALFGHALSSHPSLTSLSLTVEFLPPQWLRAFAACLAPGALPALADLRICAESTPACCVELAACLSRLPALTTFEVVVKEPLEPGADFKVVSLAAYAPLAAAPASLPHLHRLALDEKRSSSHEQAWDGFLPSLLSLLRTPALAELIMRQADGLTPQSFLDILLQFSTYENLQSVDMVAVLSAPLSSLPASDGPSRTPPQAALPASFTSVTVDSMSGESAVEIAAAFARSAAASLMSLVLSGGPFDIMEGVVPETADAWEKQLSPALRRCTGLKDLTLTCLGCSLETRSDFSAVLAAALEPLAQLTRLRLRPVDDDSGYPLRGRDLGQALSKLTALEVLQFDVSDAYGLASDHGKAEFDSAQPVLNACARLTRLQKLQLCFTGFTVAQVADLMQKLPSLTHLGLCSAAFREEVDVAGTLQSRFSTVYVHMH